MNRPVIRVVAVAMALTSAALVAEASAPLAVRLSGLRSACGRVGCALFASERGFPTEPSRSVQRVWCAITQGAAQCTFAPITAGAYAVACFHDENDNTTLDRGVFGIPTEGTVVSNHARGFMGPPSYADARFTFVGQPTTIALRVAY